MDASGARVRQGLVDALERNSRRLFDCRVLATLVPHDWWEGLFLQTGSPVGRLIENALVGPIIAMISFVCSVGNIPLASLLWSHGIGFGGVISFIYADLIVIPIISSMQNTTACVPRPGLPEFSICQWFLPESSWTSFLAY